MKFMSSDRIVLTFLIIFKLTCKELPNNLYSWVYSTLKKTQSSFSVIQVKSRKLQEALSAVYYLFNLEIIWSDSTCFKRFGSQTVPQTAPQDMSSWLFSLNEHLRSQFSTIYLHLIVADFHSTPLLKEGLKLYSIKKSRNWQQVY